MCREFHEERFYTTENGKNIGERKAEELQVFSLQIGLFQLLFIVAFILLG